MKIIGHIGYFWWLDPNVLWEFSQIWIEYIKPIGQMSNESRKFFQYTVLLKSFQIQRIQHHVLNDNEITKELITSYCYNNNGDFHQYTVCPRNYVYNVCFTFFRSFWPICFRFTSMSPGAQYVWSNSEDDGYTNTEMDMLSFGGNFHHLLYWKLSK